MNLLKSYEPAKLPKTVLAVPPSLNNVAIQAGEILKFKLNVKNYRASEAGKETQQEIRKTLHCVHTKFDER